MAYGQQTLQRDRSVRLLMFGDLMGLRGDRVPSCEPAIAELFAGADLIIGNCESPIDRDQKGDDTRSTRALSMSTDYLRDFFREFRVNPSRCVLSIANNHSGDRGVGALRQTIARLRALGVTPIGTNQADAPMLYPTEIKGVRLGLSAWTQWMNQDVFTTDSLRVMRTNDALAYDWTTMKAQLRLDSIVATPHWEHEFQHLPNRETVDVAKRLAHSGIDIIGGHHPHVVQPMDWLATDRGYSLCQYSLGSLFARTLTWPHRLSSLLEVEIATTGRNVGKWIRYSSHPLVQLDTSTGPRLVRLQSAPRSLRQKLQARLEHLFAPAQGSSPRQIGLAA